MMGAGPKKDKKFVQKIMKQLKEGKKELFVVNDKIGSPTYTHDFAKNVRLVLEKEIWGLYNMAGGDVTSRLGVAKEMVKIINLENKVIVKEVSFDYFKKDYFAVRPPCERLINRKLSLRGLNVMRDWKVTLKEYLENYYTNISSDCLA